MEDDLRDEYHMVLAFDTDDPQFARGFELGVLWHRLNNEALPIVSHIRASSAEMVMRMADTMGVRVQTREFDEDDVDELSLSETTRTEWVEVCFGYSGQWADPVVQPEEY